MLIRLQRIITSLVVPFFSVSSLIGVGYSLWVFAEPNQPIINESELNGDLKVEGLATTPLHLEILPPPGYDGYRIVYDQGGLGSRFDEEVGVRLSPTVVYCRLSSDELEIDPSTINVHISLSTSGADCNCLSKIQFRNYSSSYLSLDSTLSNLAGTSWTQESLSSSDYKFSYTFQIPIEFKWRNGQKPTESETWGNFIKSVEACKASGALHNLEISMDNGIV